MASLRTDGGGGRSIRLWRGEEGLRIVRRWSNGAGSIQTQGNHGRTRGSLGATLQGTYDQEDYSEDGGLGMINSGVSRRISSRGRGWSGVGSRRG